MNPVFLFLLLPVVAALTAVVWVYRHPATVPEARRWLVISMLCCAMTALLLMHYYIPELRLSVILDLLYDGFMLSVAPCFYMCIRSLTAMEGKREHDYRIFVPGTALWLLLGMLCLGMGTEESKMALSEIVLTLSSATTDHSAAYRLYAFFGHPFLRSYAIIAMIAVLTWCSYALRDYRHRLDDYLVDTHPVYYRSLGLLYLSFALCSVSGLILAACEFSQTQSWVIPVFSLLTAIALLLMAYFARHVSCSAEQLVLREAHTPQAEVQEGISSDPFREKLMRIEKEHLYRDPNLTIFSLSRILGTNRTYLTRAFRMVYGRSFAEYINSLRIAEAEKLMTDNPSLSLAEIAARVGYNSPTSLYRNYVRIYHHAPRGKRKDVGEIEKR